MAKAAAISYIHRVEPWEFRVTRVVYRELGPKPGSRRGKQAASGSVVEKLVVGADGKAFKIATIDANSASFSSDLHQVFARNVAKARRENKKKFGSPDRVADKA